MAELNSRFVQLQKAYERLCYMAETYVQLQKAAEQNGLQSLNQENELVTHRDALIKRFEFCYDLTWKYLKTILRDQNGIEVASPRKVFQECYAQQLLTESELTMLLGMTDIRNETTHTYDEAMADRVGMHIVEFYQLLLRLIAKLAPK